MKNICILCGSQNYQLLYKEKRLSKTKISPKEAICTGELGARGRHSKIWKCEQCNFIFQKPSFTNKELFKAYEEGEDNRYFEQFDQRKKLFQKSLKKIADFKKNKGRLLDIGCGPGLFVWLAKKSGWRTDGLEPSLWAKKEAKRRFKLNINQGLLEDFKDKQNFYDVITMWDVLEHFKDPLKSLKKTKKMLRKDGFLVLTTININSWFSKLLGKHWTWLIRVHLWYFTPQTLRNILRKTGFEIKYIGGQTRWFSFPYLLNRFTGMNFSFLPNISLPAPTGDILFVIAQKKS